MERAGLKVCIIILPFTRPQTHNFPAGPIEKGANDGQASYIRDIVAALKAAVTAKPTAKGAGKGKGKGKRKKDSVDVAAEQVSVDSAAAARAQQQVSWGLLEPLRGPLSPIVDLLSPFIKAPVVIGVLVFMVLFQWFRNPYVRPGAVGGVGLYGLPTAQRIAAYEEIWRREESELWKWLEDRVNLDQSRPPLSMQSDEDWKRQKRVRAVQQMGVKLEDASMSQRQMDEAIKVTKERLDALEQAVMRKKGVDDGAKASGAGGLRQRVVLETSLVD